jgi:acetate CoA/acetoacetate CoA-transferase alpha subunit
MKKIISLEDAVSKIKDGMSIMCGGFLGTGAPEAIIDEIIRQNIKDLTLIINDTSFINIGGGKLINHKLVKKVITSHIGTNPQSGLQMNAEELEVVLVPQGTLAEQIRAAGAGLGGVLTPVGIGTLVENDKQKIILNDKEYLIELPIKADVAIIKGYKIDHMGNILYNNSARNMNPLMATAADLVIAEADYIVEVGSIDPNHVVTPGLFVDYIVNGGQNNE